MTCFWDGILQALDTSDFQVVGCNNRLNRQQLINLLKTRNVIIEDVTWNGEKLTRQEMKEQQVYLFLVYDKLRPKGIERRCERSF